MLVAIENPNEVQAAQAALDKLLRTALPLREGDFTVGYQGGKLRVGSLNASDRIWYASKRDDSSEIPRFWNAFGVTRRLAVSRSNVITVEINVAQKPGSRRVSGLFAHEDSSGERVLVHSGRIGGGKEGVGKESFLRWYGQPTETVTFAGDDGKDAEYLRIAAIGEPSALSRITGFVEAVDRFKTEIVDEELRELSDAELRRRLLKSPARPRRTKVESIGFQRSQYVVEFVKRRAKGICELCKRKAPFSNSKGRPFLECHHITWLRHGGADVAENAAALCPNCHRKMHVVKSQSDVATLLAAANP